MLKGLPVRNGRYQIPPKRNASTMLIIMAEHKIVCRIWLLFHLRRIFEVWSNLKLLIAGKQNVIVIV